MPSFSNLPFRFTTGQKPKTLTPAAYRTIVSGKKELSRIKWNEQKECQRRENPIIYEIIPASTLGHVLLHRVEIRRGVCVSDQWETVPETDLKVELWQVRIAEATKPLPLQAPSLRGQVRTGSTASPSSNGSNAWAKREARMEHTAHGGTVVDASASSSSNSNRMAMDTDD